MLIRNCLPVVSSLALGLSVSAQVALVSWGTNADGYVANRFGTSVATSPFSFGNSEDTGGAGVAMDSAFLLEERGTFSSEAALKGSLESFLEISTYAETYLNSAVRAGGEAVEVFTYNGAGTATFSLDLNLSGTVLNTVNNPSDFAGNFGNVFVIFEDLGSFESVIIGQGEIWTTDTSASLQQSGMGVVLSDTLTFDVAPGETFTVFARGFSRMYGEGGIADASSTLTVGFSSGPLGDLTRASDLLTVIPEPSALTALMGLLGLAAIVRRRR